MHKKQVRRFFAALDLLQKAFFASYSEHGGNDSDIVRARSALYFAVFNLRTHCRDQDISKVERLYETIFLLGLLRFRVIDRALFDVCRQELAALSAVISGLLHAIFDKNGVQALADFDRVTEALHALFDSVLCITAREPEVFEFLFAHLASFRHEISTWMEGAPFAYER